MTDETIEIPDIDPDELFDDCTEYEYELQYSLNVTDDGETVTVEAYTPFGFFSVCFPIELPNGLTPPATLAHVWLVENPALMRLYFVYQTEDHGVRVVESTPDSNGTYIDPHHDKDISDIVDQYDFDECLWSCHWEDSSVDAQDIYDR